MLQQFGRVAVLAVLAPSLLKGHAAMAFRNRLAAAKSILIRLASGYGISAGPSIVDETRPEIRFFAPGETDFGYINGDQTQMNIGINQSGDRHEFISAHRGGGDPDNTYLYLSTTGEGATEVSGPLRGVTTGGVNRAPALLGYGTRVTDTPDASGYIIVDHILQFTPAMVFVQPRAPISGGTIFGQAIVDSLTATTFRVRCLTNLGAAITTPVTLDYIGVASFAP
jgi:hypothetical protein